MTKDRTLRRAIACAVLALTALPALAQTADAPKPPLVLQEQGTFFVGGTTESITPASSRESDDSYFVPGEIPVNQMYVEYQIPQDLKYDYPIVLMHGGGHTGAVYRTTPDGREGWFTSFARRGFAVYLVDAPNRGRSGWNPTKRMAVSRGLMDPSEMEIVNIYSAEAAWTAFRFGPEFGTAHPGLQFPVDHMAAYLGQAVPSYRDPVENELIAEDLVALLERIGPAILVGWSTGAGNVMTAASADIENAKAIITVEVSTGDLPSPAIDPAKMAQVPFLSLFGDYRTAEKPQEYIDNLVAMGGDATNVMLPDVGITGNSHGMMMERNNEEIADLIETWIAEHVTE